MSYETKFCKYNPLGYIRIRVSMGGELPPCSCFFKIAGTKQVRIVKSQPNNANKPTVLALEVYWRRLLSRGFVKRQSTGE